jgi:threonine/homoserine/homoserine lactone efflux protein
MSTYAPWLTLVLLGAFHGLNPGMGWLFAVALGLQEQARRAVLRAFGPIALGHAASIAVVVGVVGVARSWVTPGLLEVLGASALLTFGVYKWLRPLSHPRWVGMRVHGRDLALWSFLMATAHGAGLMLVPVLLRLPASGGAHAAHLGGVAPNPAVVRAGATMPRLAELVPVGVHTLAMFAVMALIALVVYEKVGLAILRRAWFNLDRVWAGALVAAGALTLVL